MYTEDTNEIQEWIEQVDAPELRALLLDLAAGSGEGLELLQRERALRGGNALYIKEQVEHAFKPRRRFYNYYQADDYVQDTYGAMQLLAEASANPPPELLKVIERAITLATRVVLRSDSSSGMQGEQVGELLELHAQVFQRLSALGRLTTAEQRRVVDWLFKYRYGGTQDFFDPDIVQYAGALDQKMIDRYRKHLDSTPEADRKYSGYAWVRLAVVDKDADAIMAAHGGEDANFLQVEAMLADLEEAGLDQHCLRVAQRARENLGAANPWHGEPAFLDRLERYYLDAGSAEGALALRSERHEQVRTGDSFRKLRALTADLGEWEQYRPRAEKLLKEKDAYAYLSYLLGVDRDEEAWQFFLTASDVGMGLREEMLLRRARTHPADAMAGYEALIADTLVPTDKRAYRAAAKLMKQLQKVSGAAGEEERFSRFVAATLEQNRRRPTCIAIFARAGFSVS